MCIHTVIHHLQLEIQCMIVPYNLLILPIPRWSMVGLSLFLLVSPTSQHKKSWGFIWILFQVGFFVYRCFIVAHLGCSNYFLDITHFINFMTLLWDGLNFSQKLPPKCKGVSSSLEDMPEFKFLRRLNRCKFIRRDLVISKQPSFWSNNFCPQIIVQMVQFILKKKNAKLRGNCYV